MIQKILLSKWIVIDFILDVETLFGRKFHLLLLSYLAPFPVVHLLVMWKFAFCCCFFVWLLHFEAFLSFFHEFNVFYCIIIAFLYSSLYCGNQWEYKTFFHQNFVRFRQICPFPFGHEGKMLVSCETNAFFYFPTEIKFSFYLVPKFY